MRYNEQLKTKAKKLRSEGKTYSEIKNNLKMQIPKSTLSNWCKDTPLPKEYQDKINKLNFKNFNKARKIAWTVNKIKRERLLKEILTNNKNTFIKLSDKNVLKMLLSVLYIGEGSKWRSHRGLMLGSSDPNIIKLYLRLLNLCYDITPEKLSCRISYRADQNIKKLEKYWSRITSISLKRFYKTKPDPRTIGKPTKKKNYKGVCVVSCAGTHIQLELEKIPELILEKI